MTRSACGTAQSAMGPFYCPHDQRIYLDTSFFRDLERRFRGCTGKECEFAQAYVIAHEVGHHVQNLLGVLPRAQQMQQSAGSKRRGQPHPGAGRVAGRLLRRRVGQPLATRNGTSSSRATSKARCRPRPRSATTACSADAGHGGAGFLHARLVGAAAALVHDRPEGRQGVGLQHLQRAECVTVA